LTTFDVCFRFSVHTPQDVASLACLVFSPAFASG
jgi:hypothetical protein